VEESERGRVESLPSTGLRNSALLLKWQLTGGQFSVHVSSSGKQPSSPKVTITRRKRSCGTDGLAKGKAFTSSAEASDLFDDVEFARRDMFGVAAENEEDAPRLVSFEQPRLYGLHDRIVCKVARWASWRFGKPVTPSTVQRIWKALGPQV
jgi:hypothetical protein